MSVEAVELAREAELPQARPQAELGNEWKRRRAGALQERRADVEARAGSGSRSAGSHFRRSTKQATRFRVA